jgi:hypothetical protein
MKAAKKPSTSAWPNDDYPPLKIPLKDYLFEAAAIAFVLIVGGTSSCLIASHLEGKIALSCARSLQEITR